MPITLHPRDDAERESAVKAIRKAMTDGLALELEVKDGRTILVNPAHILYAE